jgi:hypothetical protein
MLAHGCLYMLPRISCTHYALSIWAMASLDARETSGHGVGHNRGQQRWTLVSAEVA